MLLLVLYPTRNDPIVKPSSAKPDPDPDPPPPPVGSCTPAAARRLVVPDPIWKTNGMLPVVWICTALGTRAEVDGELIGVNCALPEVPQVYWPRTTWVVQSRFGELLRAALG